MPHHGSVCVFSTPLRPLLTLPGPQTLARWFFSSGTFDLPPMPAQLSRHDTSSPFKRVQLNLREIKEPDEGLSGKIGPEPGGDHAVDPSWCGALCRLR